MFLLIVSASAVKASVLSLTNACMHSGIGRSISDSYVWLRCLEPWDSNFGNLAFLAKAAHARAELQSLFPYVVSHRIATVHMVPSIVDNLHERSLDGGLSFSKKVRRSR